MIRRLAMVGLLGTGVLLLLNSGCSSTPARVTAPSISASGAASGAMEKYDTNKDGSIDAAELEKAPALKEALDKIDANHDGKITADEITARINQWKDSKLGLTSMSVSIKLDGRPLDDATVTFVPEEFLGSAVQKATGKTDKNGMAMLTIANPPIAGLTGVQPGLYRVEISKQANGQETVPAKYNTQTTLGQEVALDAKGMQEGVKFELTSK